MSLDPAPKMACVAVLWVVTSPAHAVTSATVVGLDLQRHPVRVQRLNHGVLAFFDAQRRLRVEPVDRFVQIVFDPHKDGPRSARGDDRSARFATVELNDGQRIVGTSTGAAGGGQTLRFHHAVLGAIRVSLDDMHSFRASGAAAVEPSAGPALTADRVTLVNGDVLDGFVQSISTKRLRVKISNREDAIDVPFDRVAAVRLAHAPQKKLGAADRVTLHDGSRVDATELTITADRLAFTPMLQRGTEAGALTVDLSEVARIDLAASGSRLMPLNGLRRDVVAGGRVFGLPMWPRDVDGALWMHAPVTVRIELPPGSVRMAAEASLDDGPHVVREAAVWSDFVVRLSVAGLPAGEHRLNADSPRASINIPVEGRSLGIELDPGVHGPVMDRLLLRDAVVLVRLEREP